MKFQLEIQQIERTCLFKLGWGTGQQISTIMPYTETLSQLYQTWRQAYLSFYKTALRAKVPKPKNPQGKLILSQDRHRQLVRAEAELLSEFHRWLRREELHEIRTKIAQISREDRTGIALFLTCSQELERLPWETWELGAEFGYSVKIARSPANITRANHNAAKRPRKPRILAILGDNTGLELQSDRQSLKMLQKVAEIELVTWNGQQSSTEIKQQIQRALTDIQGWEVLFFAGHSNETAITGGELAIAPNVALSVKELESELKIALANGLQFALFNSCSGLSIAKSLIDLGLSQVAVMREPVHDRVAQVFLVQFLEALTDYQDVQQALMQAGSHLKQQENLTYPSAYLIPSLFCHPEAQLYRIQPWGWQEQLKKWSPNRSEAIAASILCLFSVLPPVQNYLLNQRTLIQSIYRDISEQIDSTQAPITLVHIDEQSLSKAEITRPVPMNRQYLANLINRLIAAETQIIGIDYLFDHPQPQNDLVLAEAIANGVEQQQTWFVFGAYKQPDGQEMGVLPETKIGNPNWTLQGYTDGLPNYMSLLPRAENCSQACPFAYLLSAIQQFNQQSNSLKPQLDSPTNLRHSLDNYFARQPNQEMHQQSRLNILTTIVQYLRQQWLRPIIDFSLPPDLVYDRLPAWQLLDSPNVKLETQITIIGSGGYAQAGLDPGSDILSTPKAIAYWHTRRGLNRGLTPFTGSEVLAYMTHHWLNHRLVIPIPELWSVLTVLLIAKGIKLNFAHRILATKWLLILLSSAVTIYGLIILQLYISQAILLPWLLPSIAMFTSLSQKQVDR